jgi:hypothetical protein
MHKGRAVNVGVVADGTGLVSHVGSALLSGLADRLGLTRALDRNLAGICQRQRRHKPGAVIRDLAVMLADGGDCLAELAALRDQQSLFGEVASDSTARRLVAAADRHRPGRDADRRALREGGRSADVQARLRVSPDARLPGRDR